MIAYISLAKNEKIHGKESITVICGRKAERWTNRKEAIDFYMQGMLECEGSEQKRYTDIYLQLSEGKSICTDYSMPL